MSLLFFIKWARMILHAHRVFCVLSLIQLRSVTWFCSLFRWTCSENVYISTFSVSMFIFLKMSITWCNTWFWRVSNLHFILDNLSSLSRWCHTDTLNVIFNLIITEYIYLAFANVTSQMKISSWLSISILMTWSASIWWKCKSHCSFVFSCTLKTHADFSLRLEKLLRENFLQQIHSSRWMRSFTAQILIVYFLSMSCRCFVCNTHVYCSWFLL